MSRRYRPVEGALRVALRSDADGTVPTWSADQLADELAGLCEALAAADEVELWDRDARRDALEEVAAWASGVRQSARRAGVIVDVT